MFIEQMLKHEHVREKQKIKYLEHNHICNYFSDIWKPTTSKEGKAIPYKSGQHG